MSMTALLYAVRDQLRATLAGGDAVPQLQEQDIEVMDGPEPIPSAGDWFIAVHEGEWVDGGGMSGQCLDEKMGALITVSRRATVAPEDQYGSHILHTRGAPYPGLHQFLRLIVKIIHMDPQDSFATNVMSRANRFLDIPAGAFGNGFVEPLQFQNGGRALPRSGNWWHGGGTEKAGFSQTLTFYGARRIQVIESQS